MGPEEIMQHHAGVLVVRKFRHLRNSWSQLVRDGALIRALPGVVMDPGLAQDATAWMRAVSLWNPNAGIAGSAAALLTIDPEIKVDTVDVYANTKLANRGMLRFHRKQLPSDLLEYKADVRVTHATATALTAALQDDLEPATTAFRKKVVTVGQLTALANQWPLLGSAHAPREVAQRLSRNPWSVAEVQFHDLLRQAGISGWEGNAQVVIDGRKRWVDVLVKESRVGIEINSFEHHSGKSEMERDYGRLNELTRDGWRMYSLTPSQIRDFPQETMAFVQGIVGPRHRRR